MPTVLAAYAIAWAALSAYVVWLVVQNARLGRRLERLETLTESFAGETPRDAAAA